MDPRPGNKNGSSSLLIPGDWRDQTNLKNMSISELILELRDTFLQSDFDRVEEVLIAREAKLKAQIEAKKREIGSLQEKIEVERLDRVRAECEKEKTQKRVQSRCETLVKGEGNIGLDGKIENIGFKLGNRNSELEDAKCKLDELRNRICELEDEKKKWVVDRGVIAELRAENCRLAEEKREAESLVETWKRKVYELNEQLLLVNGDASGGGNSKGECGVTFGGNDEKKMMEIGDCGSAPLKRSGDVRKSPSIPSKDGIGASGERLGMEMVIIDDSDEDDGKTTDRKETSSGIIADNEHPISSAVQLKNLPTGVAEPVGILTRNFASSREFTYINNILDGLDSDTSSSSSSSSSGSLDMDSLPLSSLTSYKKMRTEAATLRLKSSSR